MPVFRLLLLGPVRLIDPGGQEVPNLGVKAQAILAYTAAQRDRQAGRDALAQLLWESAEGRHALRQALLVLRRRLGDSAQSVLESKSATVALGTELVTDLERFTDAIVRGDTGEACALWRGPFCHGLDPGGADFDEWLAFERAQLAERAAAAFAEVGRRAESDDRIDAAILAARQLVELDPFDDVAQARLIGLYRRHGWTGAARIAHRRCVGLFHRELGIAPSAEVQAAARAPVAPRSAPLRSHPTLSTADQRRGLGRWAAIALIVLFVAGLGGASQLLSPEAATAAAWVSADEWDRDAAPDTKGLSTPAAIERALAGDRAFAHLLPGGC